MQKESYDIEKVKEYFLYYTFPGLISYGYDVHKIITKAKADRYSVLILFFFPFLALTYQTSPFLGFILLCCTCWPLGLVYYSMNNQLVKKYEKLQILEKYFGLKKLSSILLSDFTKKTNNDTLSHGINPVDTESINVIMEHISKLLSLLTGPLIEFRKLGPSLPDEARKVLEKFIQLETDWITEYIGEFRETLKTWMEVHQSELTEHQRNNLLSKNEEVYTLASSRLSSHIENLEKVRAKL